VATADAAVGLVWHLFSNLPGKLDFQLDVLKLSITVLLYSLCHVEDLIANQEVVEVKVIGEAFQWCQLSLKRWIESTNVIGGSVFGGKSGHYLTEFKLWQSMLSTKPLRHKKISTEWSECVKQVVKPRVMEVPVRYKLSLMTLLEKMEQNVHPVLSSIVVDAVLEAIDRTSDYGSLDTYGDSHLLGLVFGRIMMKRYPQLKSEEMGSFSVPLDDLLNWSYWPDCIKLYSKFIQLSILC
jgi:hypothetical protein